MSFDDASSPIPVDPPTETPVLKTPRAALFRIGSLKRFSKLWLPVGMIGALTCWGCGESTSVVLPEEVAQRNVVVVVIDSLRADHLGSFGYDRPTSPFLDKIAAEGVTFDRAFSNSSFTQQSVSSLMSGLFPSRTGSIEWGTPPFESSATLGRLYADAGFRTAFYSNTLVLQNPLFSQGFEDVRMLGDRWDLNGGGFKLSETAIEFAQSHRDERFMMYLHYLDPHGPYRPDRESYLKFEDEVFDKPIPLYPQLRDRCVELMEAGFGPGDPIFDDLITRYDAEISIVDRAIEALFVGLEEAGVLDQTIVVVTSDHGEEFLDHGFVEHAWTLYNESLHVPLILWTRGAQPLKAGGRVSLADVLPTLLQLSGIPFEASRFDGKALFQSHDQGFVYESTDRPLVAEVLIQQRNILRSFTVGRWKYIASWKWLPPEDRAAALKSAPTSPIDIWGPPVREELYDLEEDPNERFDLATDHPEVVSRFRKHLQNYLATSPREEGREHTPLSPEEEQALKSLGYL